MAGYRFAAEWPGSLVSHVRRKYDALGSTSTVNCLGTLGKYIASTAAPSPLRDLIRSAVGKAIHAAGIPAKLYASASAAGAAREGTVTAREAEARFKMTRHTLSRMEGKSATFRGKPPGRRGTALYDVAGLERLVAARDGSVTTAAAARRLGVPIHAVFALVEEGFLVECKEADVLLAYEPGRIESSSIDHLQKRLAELPSATLSNTVELRAALRSEVRPNAWAEIVRDLVAGNLLAKVTPGSDEVLGSIRVDKRSLAAQRSRSGAEINGTVSCLAAARILGTHEQFVAAATQAGYFSGAVRAGRSEISLQSVHAFAASYVLSREAAEQLGCRPNAVRYRMRSSGQTPVATVYGQNLWDRATFGTPHARS